MTTQSGPTGDASGTDRRPLLILAAGQSSRMRGADKLMQLVGGEALVRRQVRIALEAGLMPHVALPGPDHPRARALAGLEHVGLFLPGSAEGMGGTLREGVAALPACARFMVMACDLPGLTAVDLKRMDRAGFDGRLILHASDAAGNLGHPVVFDARLRSEFAALSGEQGARGLIRAQRGAMRVVALPGDHATRDLDTPEDWDAWRSEGRG